MDTIRMRVQDDVRVVQVRVEIRDAAGTLLDAGQGTDAGTLWWEYPVSQLLPGALTVTVFASDLPGHVTQASETKVLINKTLRPRLARTVPQAVSLREQRRGGQAQCVA